MIPYSIAEEALVALADGKLDLALGIISITSQLIAKFDFTSPVARDHLTLLLTTVDTAIANRNSPGTFRSWDVDNSFLGSDDLSDGWHRNYFGDRFVQSTIGAVQSL